MNKKQLLIAATVTTFYGMNLVAENATKTTNYSQLLPEYNSFRHLCETGSIPACNELNAAFKRAAKHNKQNNAIYALKWKLEDAKQKQHFTPILEKNLIPVLEAQRNELIKNYPNHEKNYLDTLNPEEKNELNSTIESFINILETNNLILRSNDLKEIEDLFNRVK